MLSRRPAIGGRPRRRGASRRACAGAAISITDCLVGKCRASASVSIRHFRRRAGSMVSATAPDLIHVHDERPDAEVDTPAPRHGPPVSSSGRDALRCGVLFADVIVLLAVATAGLVAGRALGLPSIVAYLVAGVLVGPGGLGLVSHSAAIGELAELGVALLLFGVGIEFSLERLRRILPRMLASGALQVAGTVAATALAFRALALPWPAALFTGFLVSLSSTAIVFKLYDEEGELDAPQGLAAAGILLFQDLAMVPMMLLVPVLASAGGGAARAALVALLEGTTALAAVLVLARAVLPRVLALVARARTPELFPLAALVVAFGTALGAARLGLSLPIGAFLAGLALSGSLYAHQVFAELLPLRDAFVAIFFTSIGMLFEPAAIAGEPALLAGMVGAVLFKGLLITAIVGLFWRSTRLAVLTGFGLAQIGEFSFVLARQGGAAGVVSRGLERARAAVVAVGDPAATRRIVSCLRQTNASARILVRARRVGEIAELERLGADEAIPSEFETSIELFVRLLTHLGVPRHVVRVQESLIRLDHYQALRGVGATPDLLAQARKLIVGGILETAQVMKGSLAAGKTLAELDLRRRTGATVLSVVRSEQALPTPDGPTRLEAEDLVVLYGPHEAIDRALGVLEPGESLRPVRS